MWGVEVLFEVPAGWCIVAALTASLSGRGEGGGGPNPPSRQPLA